MATSSKKSGGASTGAASRRRSGSTKSGSSKRGAGAVSLPEVDREYLSERLGEAGEKVGEQVSVGGLFEALERFGLTSERVERLRGAIDDMEVRESIEKAQEYLGEQIENARDYARQNRGKVIGGAAGVLVGASLLAMALRRASGESGRRSRSTRSRSTGSKKSSGSSSKKSGASSSSKKSSKRR